MFTWNWTSSGTSSSVEYTQETGNFSRRGRKLSFFSSTLYTSVDLFFPFHFSQPFSSCYVFCFFLLCSSLLETFSTNVMARARTMGDNDNRKAFFQASERFKEICHLRRLCRWRRNNVKGQSTFVVKRLLRSKGFFTPVQHLLCYRLLQKGREAILLIATR